MENMEIKNDIEVAVVVLEVMLVVLRVIVIVLR